MQRPAVPHKPLSVEEYLELEESATVRHEYVGGMVYARAGTTKRHNRISLSIAAHLLLAARGGLCRIYTSTVKVRAAEDAFYYPDVMVACGPEDEDDDPLFEEDPCLIVEVVSPSTSAIDRREKLLAYKRLSGLQAYLIVEQDARKVERHWRDDEGLWWQAELTGEGTIPIPGPETSLSLAEVYEDL